MNIHVIKIFKKFLNRREYRITISYDNNTFIGKRQEGINFVFLNNIFPFLRTCNTVHFDS